MTPPTAPAGRDPLPPRRRPYFAPGRGGSPAVYRFFAGILRAAMRILGRRRWDGAAHVPYRGGVIVVANHVTELDPLVIAHFLYNFGRPPTIFAKQSLFRVPLLGWVLRATGQVPVYRNTADASAAVTAGVAALQRGECVLLYPEGTLTKDPELWPMTGKTGAARLALRTDAPVIPVAQWGAQAVLPPGGRWLRVLPRRTFHVVAGPPVDLDDLRRQASELAEISRTDDATGAQSARLLREATDRIMMDLTRLVGGLRSEEPPPKRWDARKGERL